jgi:Subtilase family
MFTGSMWRWLIAALSISLLVLLLGRWTSPAPCVPPPRAPPVTGGTPPRSSRTDGMYYVSRMGPGMTACDPGAAGLEHGDLSGFLFDLPLGGADCLSGCDGETEARTVEMSKGAAAAPESKTLPATLRRYCLFWHHPGQGDLPYEDVTRAEAGIARQAQKVLAPSASPSVMDDLHDYYVAKTVAEAGQCTAGEVAAPTRLVFVDTAPTANVARLRSADDAVKDDRHGRALAVGVHDLLGCGIGDLCPVDVRTRIAMQLRNKLEDNVVIPEWHIHDGGELGSLDYVAQSIVREVLAWKAEGGPPHLVLNLSFGWHEDHGGEAETTDPDPSGDAAFRPDVFAVLDALRYARCHGALIVAAAGNRVGGSPEEKDTGALYPAAWARVDISPDDCDAFTVESGAGARLLRGRENRRAVPLLFAVGGVGGVGGVGDSYAPLTISRLEAEPEFVAYAASFDTVTLERLGIPPLTGTSVAAALVSAAAAQLWSHRPDLDADEVMVELHAQAMSLNRAPDPLVATNPPFGDYDVRRVVLCPPTSSPPTLSITCPGGIFRCAPSEKEGCPLWCDKSTLATVPPTDPWPNQPGAGHNPSAFPQPVGHECPACTLNFQTSVSGILVVHLDTITGVKTDVKLWTQKTTPPMVAWTAINVPSGYYNAEVSQHVSKLVAGANEAMLTFKDSAQNEYFSNVSIAP